MAKLKSSSRQKAPQEMIDSIVKFPAPYRMLDSIVKLAPQIRKDPKLAMAYYRYFEKCTDALTKFNTAIGNLGEQVAIALPKPPPPPTVMMDHIVNLWPKMQERQKAIRKFLETFDKETSKFYEQIDKIAKKTE